MLKGHLGLLALLYLLVAAPLEAQTPDLDADQEALALAIAQLCANEATLAAARPADCALIYQTTRRHGDTAAERLAWLRRHSSCVLTERELTERELRGNCAWARHLDTSDAEPAGWPPHLVWERYVERWRTIRRHCWMLVAGWRPRGGWPCPIDPDTWGGEMDRARALRRGMTPLGCTGAVNEGYRFGGS